MKDNAVLWAKQYSKRLITFLLVVWVIWAVIGTIYEFLRMVTSPQTATMDSLYIYIAVPFTCGIPAYLIPNMFLNKEKVKQNYIPDYDQTILGGEYADGDGIGSDANERGNTVAYGFHADSEALSAQQRTQDISDQ